MKPLIGGSLYSILVTAVLLFTIEGVKGFDLLLTWQFWSLLLGGNIFLGYAFLKRDD